MVNSFSDNAYLVSQVKEGNIKAYNYLVNNYHDKLFSYVLALTSNNDMAKDIIQNVFLKTWENRNKLQAIYPIKSYLFKLAYNEFVSFYHKSKSISNVEKKFVEIINLSVSDDYEDIINDKKAIVDLEIENLPTKCKTVFLLSKQEGLTNEEISAYLSLSLKTVEGHITKAYTILKEKCALKLAACLFLIFGK